MSAVMFCGLRRDVGAASVGEFETKERHCVQLFGASVIGIFYFLNYFSQNSCAIQKLYGMFMQYG